MARKSTVMPFGEGATTKIIPLHSETIIEDIFMPALLWNRDHVLQTFDKQFGAEQRYSAMFSPLVKADGMWVITVRLGGDKVEHGGEVVLPPDRSEATMFIDHNDWRRGQCKGRIYRHRAKAGAACDFVVLAKRPDFGYYVSEDGFPGGAFQVKLAITNLDVDIRREMKALTKALTFQSHNEGMQNTGFRLRDVLCCRPSSSLSPAFVSDFAASASMPVEQRDSILSMLEPDSPLRYRQTPEHRAIFDAAVFGEHGLMLCSGFPGTGKTTILAESIVQKIMMGTQKILVCAQSGNAVNTIMLAVIQVINRLQLGPQGSPILRVLAPLQQYDGSPSANGHAKSACASSFLDPSNISVEVAEQDLPPIVHPDLEQFLLDELIVLWANINADRVKACADYAFHVHNASQGLPPEVSSARMIMEDARKELEAAMFSDLNVVFCTLSASAGLYDRGFHASTVYIDECGQVALPAATVPLTDQKGVEQVS